MDDFKRLEENLRGYWQTHQRTSYCLYGSKCHMMLDIFNTDARPFYRFGDIMILSKISEEHWIKYIMQSFSKTKKIISKANAHKIALIAKNHPYYVQQLSHYTWSHTKKEANDKTVEQAINMVLNTNAIFYQETCENLSNTQINLLIAIAKGETRFTSVETMRSYKLGTPRNVSKNKTTLETKDIVDFYSDKIIFVDPFFEYWFKQIFIK